MTTMGVHLSRTRRCVQRSFAHMHTAHTYKLLAIGHAAWLWHLRGLPRVVKAFETIWGTDDLLTSFDGAS